jgi:hypothetical protein
LALRITNHEVGVRFRMPTATDEQAEKTEEENDPATPWMPFIPAARKWS